MLSGPLISMSGHALGRINILGLCWPRLGLPEAIVIAVPAAAATPVLPRQAALQKRLTISKILRNKTLLSTTWYTLSRRHIQSTVKAFDLPVHMLKRRRAHTANTACARDALQAQYARVQAMLLEEYLGWSQVRLPSESNVRRVLWRILYTSLPRLRAMQPFDRGLISAGNTT